MLFRSDGALPSGNAAAAHVFVRLFAITGKEIWRSRRDRQLAFLAGASQRYASAHCSALQAMLGVLYPSTELLCVTSAAGAEAEAAFSRLSKMKLPPNTTLLLKHSGNQEQLSELAPFTADYPLPKTGTQYYLCRENTCLAPFSSLKELEEYLAENGGRQ